MEFKEIIDDGSDCDDLVEEACAYLVSKNVSVRPKKG